MLTRRSFICAAALASGSLLIRPTAARATDDAMWVMPDEADAHARTWMAFGASETIWGARLLPEVRRNLATIAKTIARYEPVSMLVRADEMDLARKLLGPAVEIVQAQMDDLWMRDTGPVFVTTGSGGKAAIGFNFNGWGEKQAFAQDASVAGVVAQRAGVGLINSSLVLEGGGIEVDGRGTAIIAESCVLNANRNPGVKQAQVEQELAARLGVRKIIWLPGIAGKDITDGHTDFYARFARPGLVLAGFDPDRASYDHAVTKTHLEILRSASDAQGNPLEVAVLEAPRVIRRKYETSEFAAGYIGFYVCNGAVIAQEFGDRRADRAAKAVLQKAFPARAIVQLNIDGIAAGGGSIHCATQQEPAT